MGIMALPDAKPGSRREHPDPPTLGGFKGMTTVRKRLKRIERRVVALVAAVFLLTGLPQIEVHDHSALVGDVGALVQHLATEHRGLDDGGMHVHDGSLSGTVVLIDSAVGPLPPTAMSRSFFEGRHPLPPGALLPYSLHRPPAPSA